jgi:hypothetical protein
MPSHPPLPPRSQLELEIGAEALRRAGVNDGLSPLARFAYQAERDLLSVLADRYPPTLDRAVDDLLRGLPDRQVALLNASSVTLASKRVAGVSAGQDETTNERARLRWLARRIVTTSPDWQVV